MNNRTERTGYQMNLEPYTSTQAKERVCKANLRIALETLGVALVAARRADYGSEPLNGIENAMKETQYVLNMLP